MRQTFIDDGPLVCVLSWGINLLHFRRVGGCGQGTSANLPFPGKYPYWTGLTLIFWKICILYSAYGIYTLSASLDVWPRWATKYNIPGQANSRTSFTNMDMHSHTKHICLALSEGDSQLSISSLSDNMCGQYAAQDWQVSSPERKNEKARQHAAHSQALVERTMCNRVA